MMTLEQAGQVVGWLNAAFPRDALEPESAAIWVTEIAELPHYDAALDAAKRIGRNGERFPSLKEFRTAYRQAFDRHVAGRELDAPDDSVPPPEDVHEWLRRMGVDRKSGGICKTIDDLPASTAIINRPVYARAMRRHHGSDLVESDGLIHPGESLMHPPTDEEKRDAIKILALTRNHDSFFGDELHVEATRILDECGS